MCIERFFKERKYPMIALHTLAEFNEDKKAAKRFTRRYLPLSLSCVAALLCLGASIIIPICNQKQRDDSIPEIFVGLAGVSFAVSIGLFVVTWRRMVSEIPISPQSRQPLEIYQLEDTAKEGKYELVYLCRQSHTYFRIVFKVPSI